MKPIHQQEWTFRRMADRVENEYGRQLAAGDAFTDEMRLISAAPDMARALMVFAKADLCGCDSPGGDGDCHFCDARKALRKAGVIPTQLPAAPDDNQP